MTSTAKRLALEILGWVLLVAGLAAMVLPGPGLILLFAGLAVLSQQYTWAERWLEPVQLRALRGAAEGVETWPRIIMSTVFALGIGVFGVVWIVRPDVPSWWPVADRWWLFGGVWTGVTLLISSVIALALLVYSYRRFHGRPEALAELAGAIEEADEEVQEALERRRRRHDQEEER
ncbi:PGPGW domain-containing protein [Nocardioides sp. SYSU DS0651]|uniref:PGPGW domain-containing protein n=1 Tax=Nocardioides sp. SYSU DS0651 TaxID=3415955 RepID=UPI003F4BC0D3